MSSNYFSSGSGQNGNRGRSSGHHRRGDRYSHHEHFMISSRITLWSFGVLAALLTVFLVLDAVRRGLYPLQEIRRKAEGITATFASMTS